MKYNEISWKCDIYIYIYGRKEMHVGFWWWKSEVKRTLGKHRRRWKDNIPVGGKGIGCVDVSCSPVSRLREVLVYS
jgi:hypothetical protein